MQMTQLIFKIIRTVRTYIRHNTIHRVAAWIEQEFVNYCARNKARYSRFLKQKTFRTLLKQDCWIKTENAKQ